MITLPSSPASSLFSHCLSFFLSFFPAKNAMVYTYRIPFCQINILHANPLSCRLSAANMDIAIVAKRMGRVGGRATGIKPRFAPCAVSPVNKMPPVVIAQKKGNVLGESKQSGSGLGSAGRSLAGAQVQPAHVLRIPPASSPRAQFAFPSWELPDFMRSVSGQDTPRIRWILRWRQRRCGGKILGRSAAHAAV